MGWFIRRVFTAALALLAGGGAGPALAGGSNYGIEVGALPTVSGRVSEWPVPTPKFARDPAPGPDGRVYVAVMNGNRIARFDPKSKQFVEWKLPEGARPHGLVVDRQGLVWYTGNGTIGRRGEVATGDGSGPRRIAAGPDGSLWIAFYGNGRLARLDPQTRRIVQQWPLPADGGRHPYAVTVDAAGRVWINGIDTDTVSLFDPRSESFRVIALPSQNVGIRKAIIDANGRYWYMGSHNGRLGVIE